MMKMSWKAVLTALLVAGGAAATSSCASAQGYDYGYYDNGYTDNGYGADYGYGAVPNGGIGFSYDSGGYCDAFGCPDDYWDLPIYYGPVFYGDSWFNGPVYYRDRFGSRQYWIRGGWRNDTWRGARPSWWHEGRYGPALGLNFYRNNGFRGRWDNNRGFDNRRFDNRQPDNRQFDNRRPDNNRSNRDFRAPRETLSPQASPSDTLRGLRDAFGNRDGGNRQFDNRQFNNRSDNDRRNFGVRDRGDRDTGGRSFGNNATPRVQAAPQPPAPQRPALQRPRGDRYDRQQQ